MREDVSTNFVPGLHRESRSSDIEDRRPQRVPAGTAAFRLGLVGVLVAYALLALFRLGWSDLGVDEGRFGISALNILSDPHQLAIVSEDPLGGIGTKPYLYPLTLAASIAVLGKTEFAIRIVNVIVLALGAFLLCLTVRSATRNDGLAVLTFSMFLLNPWTITYARSAMPEPLVICAGCLALFAVEKWRRTSLLRWAMLSGIALGLGYLAKLWLVAPFAGVAFIVFVDSLFHTPRIKSVLASVAAMCFSFLLVASSHVLLVALLAPGLVDSWLNLYFMFSLKTRVAGAGYDPAMWFRPWWFYGGGVFKATFFALPLLFVGLEVLFRLRRREASAAALVLFSPVLLFSTITVKQTSYIYPAFPGIAFVLALGCVAVWSGEHRKSLLWAAPVSAAIACFFFAKQLFGPTELLAIELLYLAYLLVVLIRHSARLAAAIVAFAAVSCTLLSADIVVVSETLQHRTHYREIAAFLTGDLQKINPQDLAFIAPEFPSMEFYTFRSGEYWGTFYRHASVLPFLDELRQGRRRFYIVDRAGKLYGSHMLPEVYDALQKNTRDITSEVQSAERQKLDVQIFEKVD